MMWSTTKFCILLFCVWAVSSTPELEKRGIWDYLFPKHKVLDFVAQDGKIVACKGTYENGKCSGSVTAADDSVVNLLCNAIHHVSEGNTHCLSSGYVEILYVGSGTACSGQKEFPVLMLATQDYLQICGPLRTIP